VEDDEEDEVDEGDEDEVYKDDGDENDEVDVPVKLKPTICKRHIPTKVQQRTSSTTNLYTNGLDLPKYNKMHKAQLPVSANAPGFKEALKELVIPPEMALLYTRCLAFPKE
jgi:hypothetical protein